MILLILLIVLGMVAGMAAGLFGIGGGLLFTPILFYLFQAVGLEQPVTWAIATSLFCTFSASLSSSIQQHRERNIYWREGIWVGLTGSAGVYVGKSIVLAPWFSTRLFAGYFTLILLWAAISFLRKSQISVEATTADGKEKSHILYFTAAGGLGGMVAALAGVGGGIVMVPLMTLLYRIPVRKAVSISSLAIVMISLSGWLQFSLFAGSPDGATQYTLGFVDFGTAVPLIAGAFAGGIAGVRLGVRMNQNPLYFLYAALIALIAISMVLQLIR